MSNDLVPYSDVERMGVAIAKSGLFGMKTPEQAIALMLIAQAEGNHPAIAARDYHVIQGRPTLKADAMLARFQAQGGKVQWGDYNDKRVVGTFSHPQGGSVQITWTIEMAQKIGLTGKDNWKHYPRQMLRARVISEGVRTVYPGVAVGIYTPEEAQDFDPVKPPPKEKVVEPHFDIQGEVVLRPEPAPRVDKESGEVRQYVAGIVSGASKNDNGKPWADIPRNKLQWYVDISSFGPEVKEAAKVELARRDAETAAAAEPRNTGSDRDDTRETLADLENADRPF